MNRKNLLPRVREIEIDGHKYHMACDEKVWKEEAKRFWFKDAWSTPSADSFHWHHTAGRFGVLKLMVENSCPVPTTLHIFEKTAQAQKLYHFVYTLFCTTEGKGEDLWLRLMKIRQKEKFNPSVEKMK